MATLLMDFYNAESGVQLTLEWRNEDEYTLGKKFLRSLLGGEVGSSVYEADGVPFYYLRNDRDLDALLDFRRRLREKQ